MRSRGEGTGRGKVILLGEHAVVHGTPALAAAIDRGATAIATPGAAHLSIEPWKVSVPRTDPLPLARAFDALLGAMGKDGVDVKATITLPGGAGLGSSAALGVAVLRAIDQLFDVERDQASAEELALIWERVFHGNPSGVDTAMALAGGVAVYLRHPPAGTPRLRPIRPKGPFRLVIGASGEGASTKEMVEEVARQLARAPERTRKTFAAIESLVNNAELALLDGDLRALGQLMDMNQALLSSLMVSTAALEEMCIAARGAGALGAKLTGGGGGGCMIALVDSDEAAKNVQDALRALDRPARTLWAGAST